MPKFNPALLGLVLLIAGGVGAFAQTDAGAPRYKVDPFWPKELPNNWIMGQVGGLAVDAQDHIWVLQRPGSVTKDEYGAAQTPPRSGCCQTTPPVLEFDTAGNLLRSWGGLSAAPDWPKNEHAIAVDKAGHVWISGSGSGDRQVLKFSPDGKLLMEIGHPSTAPRNNQDASILGQPAGIDFDEAAHEVYIADGYLNNRVVVYDADTGAFKRGWGAYGVALDKIGNEDQPKYAPGPMPDPQFRSPVHCARLSKDGLVYVCDRINDRIQIFTKAGKFLKEYVIHPETLGNGTVWNHVNFSHDPEQKYLLVNDGENNVVWILRRSDGALVSHFGHAGRSAGQFHWVHQGGMDSAGNYYTGEVDTGKRVQKFLLEGAAP